MNIEIKVQCKGNAAGTLGWLNQLLENTELVIKNSKDGTPAMFAHAIRNSNTGELNAENAQNTFICKVFQDQYSENYDVVTFSETRLKKCYVQAYDDNIRYGFVNIPLTKAAWNKLDEFIDAACLKYAEWWESDK